MNTNLHELKEAALVRLLAVFVLATACLAAVGLAQSDAPPGAEIKATGPPFVGKLDICVNCHEKEVESQKGVAHSHFRDKGKLVSDEGVCAACHGERVLKHEPIINEQGQPDTRHTDLPPVVFKKLSPQERDRRCLACHKENTFLSWRSSEHSLAAVTCDTCHLPHADRTLVKAQPFLPNPTELCYNCHAGIRLQTALPSRHPIWEGKMSCRSCHNPHGGGKGSPREETWKDVCLRCHAEYTGPYLYEHSPASESCQECHTPHGSIYDNLLSQGMPFLCFRCHKVPHRMQQQFLTCSACHHMIHGSDQHPKFTY
ncbi:MAG: hypothetical protein HYU64_16580 [Armatimonadetes bacterium]|nr:hypothetical protein [Armatimonadota bacterium]